MRCGIAQRRKANWRFTDWEGKWSATPQLSGRSSFKRRRIFQDFADDLGQRSQLRAVDEAMIDGRGNRKLLLRHTLAVFYDRPLAHRTEPLTW